MRNVGADVQNQGLSAFIDIDRDTAARLGVTAGHDRRRPLRRLRPADHLDHLHPVQPVPGDPGGRPDAAADAGSARADLPAVVDRAAAPTPLSAFATIESAAAPLQVNHVGQFPAANLSFDIAPGRGPGRRRSTAIREAEKPRSGCRTIVTTFPAGAANAFQASLGNELWLILAAIVTVYIVLGVLYESYIHPITILSTLPSAGVGALLALMLFGQDLGVIGIIGIILLIGIVKKNAIMMIDFALDAERNEGKSPAEAIHQAALLRFRPILMTTLAALFGAAAADAGLRRGLGAAPAARHLHRRRPDRQPGADPVHHAGDLSGVRPAGPPEPRICARASADPAISAGRAERGLAA